MQLFKPAFLTCYTHPLRIAQISATSPYRQYRPLETPALKAAYFARLRENRDGSSLIFSIGKRDAVYTPYTKAYHAMMGKCSKGERGHPNRTRNMRSDLWEAHPCASRIHQPCFSHPEQPTHKCFTQPWGPSHGASPNHGVLHTGSTFLGVPHTMFTGAPPMTSQQGIPLLTPFVAKGEHGHPTRTRTQVYRVPNMLSDRHTKEPGSMAWQPESIFIRSDDHIVTLPSPSGSAPMRFTYTDIPHAYTNHASPIQSTPHTQVLHKCFTQPWGPSHGFNIPGGPSHNVHGVRAGSACGSGSAGWLAD